MNLAALPDLRAADNPLGPAVADDNIDLNNTQFLGAVQRAAGALRGQGVSAGDVVAARQATGAGQNGDTAPVYRPQLRRRDRR